MNQLTVRGFDRALARRIREVAKARGLSLNQAVVLLIRQGAGLLSGFRQGTRLRKNLAELDAFIDNPHSFDVAWPALEG